MVRCITSSGICPINRLQLDKMDDLLYVPLNMRAIYGGLLPYLCVIRNILAKSAEKNTRFFGNNADTYRYC
ncbi:hypothetical protein CW304_21425 [Bacillus sp. UFRGS-B20]|nr:hypothetical protein CW304_21425 [Bacillus sp. UFRGS-B20]